MADPQRPQPHLPVDSDSVAAADAQQGFALLRAGFAAEEIAALLRALEPFHAELSVAKVGGARDLFRRAPAVAAIALDPRIMEPVRRVLGASPFAVRALLFDKQPQSNWKVPWHQDVTIAVASRQEIPGFGPWSKKAGVTHVQPPRNILERMVSVRLHLDRCDVGNGSLRVIPGSHRQGVISSQAVAGIVAGAIAVDCEVPAGGLLMMRPLLLHASGPSERANHRRVIHLDFAAVELPAPLKWHERIAADA